MDLFPDMESFLEFLPSLLNFPPNRELLSRLWELDDIFWFSTLRSPPLTYLRASLILMLCCFSPIFRDFLGGDYGTFNDYYFLTTIY